VAAAVAFWWKRTAARPRRSMRKQQTFMWTSIRAARTPRQSNSMPSRVDGTCGRESRPGAITSRQRIWCGLSSRNTRSD